MEKNFVSGKAVAIDIIEFLVAAVFQGNSCCAQHSSPAADISVPLSKLFAVSSPTHPL